MPLVAHRFLVDEEDGVIDLATGAAVRLTVTASLSREAVRQRAAMCDQLSVLRHPLLVPLLDYGSVGRDWFEAHALLPPLRVVGIDARRAALHLVRFLGRSGIALTGDAAGRHVRPSVEGSAEGWRPIGIVHHARAAIERVRTVLECDGPPGVTAITLQGREGAGLRTARLELARVARRAGYTVIDSRFGPLPDVVAAARPLCVFDWLTRPSPLPSILAIAAATGVRRHAWIRFCRRPADGSQSLELEPLVMRDLVNIVYVDQELGPSAAGVRVAAAVARGLPGALTTALARPRPGGGSAWVHETAPAYLARSPDAATESIGREANRGAGVARLERAASAALSLAARGRHARAARVLRRCADALAVRGARAASASVWCALGELHLGRGRPAPAAEAFERARHVGAEPATLTRALLGAGRAHLDQGHISDAEAEFRRALLANPDPIHQTASRTGLAITLFLRRRFDAAEQTLAGRSPALLSRIRLAAGDVAGAAEAAADAVRVAAGDAAQADAHAAAACVEAALHSGPEVCRHAEMANRAARRTRDPVGIWQTAAETARALSSCRVVVDPAHRRRILRMARRLPALAAARIRAAMLGPNQEDPDLRRFVERSGATLLLPPADDRSDLIQRFQAHADVIHATPDELSALQAIASDILRAAEACSVSIRSVRLGRIVASAGRVWPSEAALTAPLLAGADGTLKGGITPEAAEPVRAGGVVLGSVAVRWGRGANPPPARIMDLLRVAAATAVPLLRALTVPNPEGASTESQFPDARLGRGPAAERVREAIRRAAAAPYPVLIEGGIGR